MSTLLARLNQLMQEQRARTVSASVQITESAHLILCGETGRLLGMQRSLTMQGRTFSAQIVEVVV